MTQVERDRFHNLLLLAKESPFEGERRNALSAAERLAANFGLTLEEAARSGGETYQSNPTHDRVSPAGAAAQRDRRSRFSTARVVEDIESRVRSEKARFEEALAAARARGLDADKPKPAKAPPREDWHPRRRAPGRPPLAHARILLTDTELPIGEIASIAGLDIWTVAGLKLKLRSGETNSS